MLKKQRRLLKSASNVGIINKIVATKQAAKALIFNPAGQVLVLRRSATHPYVPYTYDLPGGELEAGETAAEGLVREIKEETHIELQKNELVEIDHNELDAFGRHYHVVLFVVELTHDPIVTLSSEHDTYGWQSLEKAKIVGVAYEPMIERYIQLGKRN